MISVKDRFLKYIQIDTQSDENSNSCPSTVKQLDLARVLCDELNSIGMTDVELDSNGYIMATLPSNAEGEIPIIGFIAHMDTSPDMSGANVRPRLINNYNGETIVLNKEDNVLLSPDDFHELLLYVNQDLIVTDGRTLLGADDKAGISEIMTAMEYLIQHPEIKHGKIRIAFTVDEEIGRGADHFDVPKFGADYAYTIDGGQIGELEFENFNAALASIKIAGRNVHPGTAKNMMVNSIHLAMEFNSLLPAAQRPEHTEGYEGFYHLMNISGTVEETTFRYIIRDHDINTFKKMKLKMQDCADQMNKKYAGNRIQLEIKDQYFNMKEKVEPVKFVVEIAEQAMKDCGVTPRIQPIRGGTDGSRLSYMGLPCPNIFAGGHNFHGKYEFIPVQSMEKSVRVISRIAELFGMKK